MTGQANARADGLRRVMLSSERSVSRSPNSGSVRMYRARASMRASIVLYSDLSSHCSQVLPCGSSSYMGWVNWLSSQNCRRIG